MKTKDEIRAVMRSAVSMGDDAAIWRKLEELPCFASASAVLLYWSIGGEPYTHDFISNLALHRTVLLPRVVGDSLELREYEPEAMTSGYKGIMEPGEGSRLCDVSEVSLAVVPGLAFDPSGRRLGRGKGYYDRLLPKLDCPRIGVCFDSHLLDEVPVEAHDVLMDLVITPNNLYICNK